MLKPYIADIITLSRIVGSINLIYMPIDSMEFLIMYTYCGISDALDGFVARKLKIESKLGSVLDSISDLIFYAVMLYKVWPILKQVLPSFFFVLIWTIMGVRLACYMFVLARDKKIASEHFLINKISGLLMFLIPYLVYTKYFVYYAALIIFVTALAAFYEFRYHLTGKK